MLTPELLYQKIQSALREYCRSSKLIPIAAYDTKAEEPLTSISMVTMAHTRAVKFAMEQLHNTCADAITYVNPQTFAITFKLTRNTLTLLCDMTILLHGLIQFLTEKRDEELLPVLIDLCQQVWDDVNRYDANTANDDTHHIDGLFRRYQLEFTQTYGYAIRNAKSLINKNASALAFAFGSDNLLASNMSSPAPDTSMPVNHEFRTGHFAHAESHTTRIAPKADMGQYYPHFLAAPANFNHTSVNVISTLEFASDRSPVQFYSEENRARTPSGNDAARKKLVLETTENPEEEKSDQALSITIQSETESDGDRELHSLASF